MGRVCLACISRRILNPNTALVLRKGKVNDSTPGRLMSSFSCLKPAYRVNIDLLNYTRYYSTIHTVSQDSVQLQSSINESSPTQLPHISSAAEISFEVDQEDENNQFIRFNPLPSRWVRGNRRGKVSNNEKLIGHKLSVDEIYTGRAKNTIPSIEFYSEISEKNIVIEKDLLLKDDKLLFEESLKYVSKTSSNSNSNISCFIGSECYRNPILPGDLIEICNRDGQTIFGLVLENNNKKVKLLSIDGTISDVRIRQSFHSSSRNISIILRGLFGSYFQNINTNLTYSQQQIFLYFINQFIKRTFNIISSLSPYLQPVYAYLAQSNSLTATNIEFISEKMVIASRNAFKSRIDSSPLSQLSILFATYLSSCGNNLRFARLSIDSPITTLSENSFDAVVKIMHYLTDQELNSYVNNLQMLLNEQTIGGEVGLNLKVPTEDTSLTPITITSNTQSTESITPIVNTPPTLHTSASKINTISTPTGLAPLLILLNHYILCPDPRLSGAIKSIISKIYPDRDSDIWLSSPSTVFKLLRDCGLADKSNPVLPSIVDSTGLRNKFKIDFKRKRRPKRLYNTVKDWRSLFKSPLPAYKIKGVHDVLFSIYEESNQPYCKLYIHIPDLSSMFDKNEPAVETLIKLGKSSNSQNNPINLFEREFIEDLNITKFWTFSITVPAYGDDIDLNNCDIIQTNISKNYQIEIDVGDSSTEDTTEPPHVQLLNRNLLKENNPHLKRNDILNFLSIKSSLEKFFWKRVQNGSIFDIPISSRTYSSDLEAKTKSPDFTITDVINESKLLAGVITGIVGKREAFPLLYVGQNKLKEPNELTVDLSERKSKGSISTNTKVLAETYLTQEIISDQPIPYYGLGVDSYVHIANPFQDILSLCSQWSLHEHLQAKLIKADNNLDPIFVRNVIYNNQSYSLRFIQNVILPQRDLVSHYHERLFRFSKLLHLEEELRASKNYYIFRCQIIEEAEFPEMAVAFCHELQMVVDITLLPDTSVITGDTILCTEIIELNPIDGLLVLGL